MPSLAAFAAFKRVVPPVPRRDEAGGTAFGLEIPQQDQRLTAAVPPVPPVPPVNDMIRAETGVPTGASASEAKNPSRDLYILGGTGGTGGTPSLSGCEYSQILKGGAVPPRDEAGGTGGTGRPAEAHPLAAALGREPDEDLVALYEERAGIREFDGGMTRADAEAAAIGDVVAAVEAEGVTPDLETPAEPVNAGNPEFKDRAPGSTAGVSSDLRTPTLAVPGAEACSDPSTPLAAWRGGLARLSPSSPPCPGPRAWPATLAAARRFLDEHGATAAALGWTMPELFGVHPAVGTIRPDCTGALMMSSGVPVIEVTAELIRFDNGLAYRRRKAPMTQSVPAWEFGR